MKVPGELLEGIFVLLLVPRNIEKVGVVIVVVD
jgi:hypothetical protein